MVLRHGTHTHPLTTRTRETASFTAGDDHDADSDYEITLIATDSRGLRSQKTVIIKPKTAQYTLDSDPAGVNVSYGGISAKTPMTWTSAVGYRTTISASQTVVVNGRTLSFDRWSDGGARSHDVVIPDTDWTRKGDGLAQRTPDLSALVQEVVNRSGWASNNALAFVIAVGIGRRSSTRATRTRCPSCTCEYE